MVGALHGSECPIRAFSFWALLFYFHSYSVCIYLFIYSLFPIKFDIIEKAQPSPSIGRGSIDVND